MPRRKRVGLRPLSQPVIGTYWKATKPYGHEHGAPTFVAVINTERKYARMGMQECFVCFVPAACYATKEVVPSTNIPQDTFMCCFRKVEDDELSSELGLEILAHYG